MSNYTMKQDMCAEMFEVSANKSHLYSQCKITVKEIKNVHRFFAIFLYPLTLSLIPIPYVTRYILALTRTRVESSQLVT